MSDHHHGSTMETKKRRRDSTSSNSTSNNNNIPSASVWVRLYEGVIATNSNSNTTTTVTHRAIGRTFKVTPVPNDIDALCKAVKTEFANTLKDIDAPKLVAYEFLEPASATDEINLPTSTKKLSSGDKVPFHTTSLTPLVIVAPAMTAITSTAPVSASAQAPEMEKAIDTRVALSRAAQFAESIMKDMEEIPESNGMWVMRDVVKLETGTKQDIIIRRVAKPFWDECIDLLNASNMRNHVCAVGTPGIGKTASTPFLIRMLLKQAKMQYADF